MDADVAAEQPGRALIRSEDPDSPRILYACPGCSGELSRRAGLCCSGCGASFPERDGILRLVTTATGSPAYDPHYFHTLPVVEATHFWFLARRELVLETLRRFVPDLQQRQLFDIGCGSGGLIAWLLARGVPIAGACDAYPEALQLARRKLDVPLALVDEGRIPPLACGHSLIGLFDVLEHLDDDESTLRALFRALRPGGMLVLTVPAHPSLFDEADVIAGHRRRYRSGQLRERLVSAGFEVARLTHFMAPLACVLAALRLALRLFTRGLTPMARRDLELRKVPFVNEAMLAVLWLERMALRRISLPFGTSLIALAVRPDTAAPA